MPTSAVITSIESAIMMVWLTPSMISGSASGSCDLAQQLAAGAAGRPAASISAGSIWRMPWSV